MRAELSNQDLLNALIERFAAVIEKLGIELPTQEQHEENMRRHKAEAHLPYFRRQHHGKVKDRYHKDEL